MKAQIALEQRAGAVTPWGKARLAFSKASYRKRLGLGFLLQAGNQSVSQRWKRIRLLSEADAVLPRSATLSSTTIR